MDDLTTPEFFIRPDGLRLAYRHHRAKGDKPTIIFLPGYKSDMLGGKAIAVADWAAKNGHAMLRLDYSGCGESDGAFEDGTLSIWRDDVLMLIDTLIRGPVVVIGSSMGGWLALLIALARPTLVAGLIGIAPAPDFTDWGFTSEEKGKIAKYGRLERASDYGPEPMVTTRGFWESGEANRLLDAGIAIDCPIRLLHGQCDDVVPWPVSTKIAERVRSADVQMIFVKDGDHRLSREPDIALLIAITARLMDQI